MKIKIRTRTLMWKRLVIIEFTEEYLYQCLCILTVIACFFTVLSPELLPGFAVALH